MSSRLPVILLAALLLAGCDGSAASGAGSHATPLPTEPRLLPPRPGAYAALGASETYGTGAVPHTRGYAYLVARALRAQKFVDTGIPGTTLRGGYETELTSALAIRPALATVFFGVNDLRAGVTRAAFLADLRDLVATLRAAGTRVLIVGLPDLSRLPAVRAQGIGGAGAIVRRWNAGMRAVARRTGAHYLDLAAFGRLMATHPGYIASDGLHPSTAGHRRLAAVVLTAIRRERLWRAR